MNPNSLDNSYLDRLNAAVSPATKAGLQVEYGAGAGQIGSSTNDLASEVIGLALALVLLLLMFGSLMAAAIPLVSAIFSVLSGLALLGLLAHVVTFPATAPTIATLLGLGVAVDYGLFLVARHREQVDSGEKIISSVRRAAGTSGAAIAVAGSTVAVSVLGCTSPASDSSAREGGAGASLPLPDTQAGRVRAAAGGADRRGHPRTARAQRVRSLGPIPAGKRTT